MEQKDDTLVILLDLSLSMLAQDVQPSRIARARQKVVDILRTREEGTTALVAYAGDAHAVVPLTDDVATIENLLASLSPEMMPVFGSNPDHALILAHELFENGLAQQGRIVMITDGIDDINDVSRHRSAAYPISILGVGTYDGAPIPLDRVRQPGRYLQTQEGERVIAVLDEDRLRDVTALTFGTYATVGVGDADIVTALSTTLPGEDETIDVEREFDTWFDQGHWLALLLVPILLTAFRRGVLVSIMFVVGLSATIAPQPAQANVLTDAWDSLWQNRDQRGQTALRHGEPEKAATLFTDPDWQSVARYRSGDYGGALGGFATDQSARGRYNQGNALARLGEYEAALERYDSVLAEAPEHADAQFNRDLVARLLEEKQDAEQQQNQDQQDEGNNEQSDSEQQQQEEEQEQSEQEEAGDESEEQEQDSEQQDEQQEQGEEQQAQAEQTEEQRDEKQDALEQWLRRVPDDPGGLLRRKFSHETKQRLRRGDYEHRQGEKVW